MKHRSRKGHFARASLLADRAMALPAMAVLFATLSILLGITVAANRRIKPLASAQTANELRDQDQTNHADTVLPAGVALDACGSPFIANIERFLDTCPASDPATIEILTDFQIRRNGALVGEISCSEPISQLPVARYTDELIVLQGLRVIYYMDRGKRGHLPWTPGSMYDWMRSKIQGIDIRDGSGSFCCERFDNKLHIAVGAQNDFNRDFDRKWEGISGNIGLYAHETRHVDGFSHTSCCGIASGCDQTYDQNSLSPYAIQWWLEKSWLMGDINVGFSCMSPSRVSEIVAWHSTSANGQFRDRFCDEKPPLLTPVQLPGGRCAAVAPDFALTLTPDTRTVAPGETATFTIEVGPVDGQSPDFVNLCATISSPGGRGTVAVSPSSVSPGSTASLTLTTPSDATTGDYVISLGGTSGLHTHTRTATVMVVAGSPSITGAEVIGKQLVVYGGNFDSGAKLLLNGEKQKKTFNDEVTPATKLIARKSGRNIAPGDTVTLQVRNLDSRLSNEFRFKRPIE